MTVQRLTIGDALSRIVGLYRRDASRAARNNTLISQDEAKRLTPWARTTLQSLRDPESSMRVSVDRFIDAVALKVKRALLAISHDGKHVERTALHDLHVMELRARAVDLFASLFSIEDLEQSIAVETARFCFRCSPYRFELGRSLRAGESTEAILDRTIPFSTNAAATADIPVALMDRFDVESGARAVNKLAALVFDHVEEFASPRMNEEQRALSGALETLAAHAKNALLPVRRWTDVKLYSLKKQYRDAEYFGGTTASHDVLIARAENGEAVVLHHFTVIAHAIKVGPENESAHDRCD